MVRVTVWVPLVLLVLTLKQSHEDSDQFSDREIENRDLETHIERKRELKQQNETFNDECKEQLRNKKRVSAAAFSLLKLSEDEFKCDILRSEKVISVLIKQLQAKDGALHSNNENILQMQASFDANNQEVEELLDKQKQLQATIDGLKNTVEVNNLRLQQLREKRVEITETIDCQTITEEANERIIQELREKQEKLQSTIDGQRQREEIYNRTLQQLLEMEKQLKATVDGLTEILEALNHTSKDVCRNLFEAVKSGEVNSVKTFVKYGNDTCTIDDEYRNTPLTEAAKYGRVEVVRVLLEGGAKVESTDAYQSTALHTAAWNGYLDVCRLLLDWGAKVNAVNKWKYTPLISAARWRHWSVVKLLVERGADVWMENEDGQTASDWARREGKKDVAEWLDRLSRG